MAPNVYIFSLGIYQHLTSRGCYRETLRLLIECKLVNQHNPPDQINQPKKRK